MKDSDDIDELYQWVNQRYEQYTEEEISEEQYLEDLDYYKRRLAELEDDKSEEVAKKMTNEEQAEKPIDPSKVRSTSIAGLRKKLMDEMKK